MSGVRSEALQGGGVLVVALLLLTVLTLLGLAYAWIAQTEMHVARNELRTERVRALALATLGAVRQWFDSPGRTAPVPFPLADEVERGLRRIDPDGPGPAPPREPRAGARYKLGVDRDADGKDDLFDLPYQGSETDAFLGTSEGPDVRITDRDFLDRLLATLHGARSSRERGLRIDRIDLYGPPYVRTDDQWRPAGVARIRVVALLERRGRVVARGEASAVLESIPYAVPAGPIHSCAGFRLAPGSRWPAAWGPVVCAGALDPGTDWSDLPASLPRSPSGSLSFDPVWGSDFASPFETFRRRGLDSGEDLEDPWLRIVAGGRIRGAPARAEQPEPSPWAWWNGAGSAPAAADRSHALQAQTLPCPSLDYATWKRVASSGGPATRYFSWLSGDRFRENGSGPARRLAEWTAGRSGIYFFDTRDGRRPDPSGRNLTPAILVDTPEDWSFSGMLWVNARILRFGGVRGLAAELRPPGEPFQDRDRNGEHDAATEPWLALAYPPVLGDPFHVSGRVGPRRFRAPRGLAGRVGLRGLLYTSGRFDPGGRTLHYGSVISLRGVIAMQPDPGRSVVYWDATIREWPRSNPDLPRVFLGSRRSGAPIAP